MTPGNKLMAASIQEKNGSLLIGKPQLLFQTDSILTPFRNYDVTADGETFLLITRSEHPDKPSISLITNWTELLQKK
jgi:hypothetical protein